MRKIVISLLLMFLLIFSSFYFFALPIAKNKYWFFKKKNIANSFIDRRLIVKNNLLLNGFQLVEEYPAIIKDSDNTLLFIGHIYPRNEYLFPSEKKPQGNEHPLLYLAEIAKNTPPARIIFGGDNLQKPSNDALEHLKWLKHKVLKSETRFVIGNHDSYWSVLLNKPRLFDSIYKKRYWYEDVNGVRLIYLHSIDEKGSYEIDTEQLAFLIKTLDPSQYRYALLFQHHALWAGNSLHANTEYPDAIKKKETWKNKILPLIKAGNVKAVFSGDGGWRLEGRSMKIDGIPHYITGWTYLMHIPPEWLTIKLETNAPQIIWHKLFEGNHYIKNR